MPTLQESNLQLLHHQPRKREKISNIKHLQPIKQILPQQISNIRHKHKTVIPTTNTTIQLQTNTFPLVQTRTTKKRQQIHNTMGRIKRTNTITERLTQKLRTKTQITPRGTTKNKTTTTKITITQKKKHKPSNHQQIRTNRHHQRTNR